MLELSQKNMLPKWSFIILLMPVFCSRYNWLLNGYWIASLERYSDWTRCCFVMCLTRRLSVSQQPFWSSSWHQYWTISVDQHLEGGGYTWYGVGCFWLCGSPLRFGVVRSEHLVVSKWLCRAMWQTLPQSEEHWLLSPTTWKWRSAGKGKRGVREE